MTIDLLTVADCPHTQPTLEVLHRLLAERNIRGTVHHVVVTDVSMAQHLQFPGSPTVRINGRDVEPNHNASEYGLACRVYRHGNVLSGVPPAALIEAAMRMPGIGRYP
jgi:hypothetical protein